MYSAVKCHQFLVAAAVFLLQMHDQIYNYVMLYREYVIL